MKIFILSWILIISLSYGKTAGKYVKLFLKNDKTVDVRLFKQDAENFYYYRHGKKRRLKKSNVSSLKRINPRYCLKSRIGDINDSHSKGLIFSPGSGEFLIDFDSSHSPMYGVSFNKKVKAVVVNQKYYMSAPNSLGFALKKGGVISFKTEVLISKQGYSYSEIKNFYFFLSMGIFQKSKSADGLTVKLLIECLGQNGQIVLSDVVYLRRIGWNILTKSFGKNPSINLNKVKVSYLGKGEADIYIDNLMIYIGDGFAVNSKTIGIFKQNSEIELKKHYPPKSKLTKEEIKSFQTIRNRMISIPSKTQKYSEGKMNQFRNYVKNWEIKEAGDFASGLLPIYYSRKARNKKNRGNSILYNRNEKLCQFIQKLGYAYAKVLDENQKKELGDMFLKLLRFTVTYGSIPTPWYNGRGYVLGSFYGLDLLKKDVSLLNRLNILIKKQYNLGRILYNKHDIYNPPNGGSKKGHEFFYRSHADALNTDQQSILIGILNAQDTVEKARDLYRYKSWLDKIALAYSPGSRGVFKPDGSMFHHWGNRFDNYAWNSGWRGAMEVVYWLSGTSFAVSDETFKRMKHITDVHFKVMDDNRFVGGPDNRQVIDPSPFLLMAKAEAEYSSMSNKYASYWLRFNQHRDTKSKRKLEELKIKPAKVSNFNLTLSYTVNNIHYYAPWYVYTRGLSKNFYNTQYIRDGFLFYNIGGLAMVNPRVKSGMMNEFGKRTYVASVKGYNYNFAPGVTSIEMSYDRLKQGYYQIGSSTFVGGASSKEPFGVFVQKINTQGVKGLKNANGLAFKKSYFFFKRFLVLIGSDIDTIDSTDEVNTGVLQEDSSGGRNVLTLSSRKTISSSVLRKLKSHKRSWIFNKEQKTGYYIMPSQNYRIFKGKQTFGKDTGEITKVYIEHSKKKNWYEWIVVLNTTDSEMNKIGENLASKSPLIKVERRDEQAHVVSYTSEGDNVKSYVIYKGQLNLNDIGGIIQFIDKPCVVISQIKDGNLVLNIANPDLNFGLKSPSDETVQSLPLKISIKLKGVWKGKLKMAHKVDIKNNLSKGFSMVTVILKNGLTTEVKLSLKK